MAGLAHSQRLQAKMSSQLTSQLQKEQSSQGMGSENDPVIPGPRTAQKPRSWSSLELKPALSPSPAFLEPPKTSKDDTHIGPYPTTPQRPSLPPRGLSLQMPPRDTSSSSTANLTTNLINRVPLSPKLDSTISYSTAASVLPRRSRGLDFSRACTNLHHSTLAEQSSPDSSPVISGRAMLIPSRKGFPSGSQPSVPSSPASAAHSLWSTIGNVDRPAISSSVGSVNMLDSDSDSDASEMEDIMRRGEDEDTVHMTPQVGKSAFGLGNPFVSGTISSPGMEMMNPFSPAAANLMSFQRARLRNGRSRKSSSSISDSRRNSMPSPGPSSPPLLKSIESNLRSGYFNKDNTRKSFESRRESLSLGTNDLHISDGVESEGEGMRISPTDALGIPIPVTPTLDERRNVIRRAVTRRGNLLPKPKNFARIRAALQEEGSPIDTESRREAEVIRQVRESDADVDSTFLASGPATTASSPSLFAATAGPIGLLDDIPDGDLMSPEMVQQRRPSSAFTQQAIRHCSGVDFWNRFDERMRTPPPSLSVRGSSSGISDEMMMDTPVSSMPSMNPQQPSLAHLSSSSSRSRSSTPQPTLMAVEVSTRVHLGKRRRDDDLDPNMFKRRAVSPGVSLQNSPVLPPSPAQRDTGWWAMKSNRELSTGHVSGDRVNSGTSSNGSSNLGPAKRIGFQGMSDTNDGLMNMSIE